MSCTKTQTLANSRPPISSVYFASILNSQFPIPQVNALGLMAGKAEKVSLAVCRMLVTSGLDFDAVLDDFKREGPDKAELRLRTAFLNKMSCQSKAVIDQGGARSLRKILA